MVYVKNDLFDECAYIAAPVNFRNLSKKEQTEKREEELESINDQVVNAIELAIECSNMNLPTIKTNDKEDATRAILENIINETERMLGL